MKLLKPMRWKEGMFLRPHHFQQHDLYLEAREASRFQALNSHGWGLLELTINDDALTNFVLEVETCRAVFRDGLAIQSPENARILRREFGSLMQEAGRPLDVALGIRAADDRGPHTQADGEAMADARFLAAEEEVYDLEEGRNPAPVDRLLYNVRIFFGDENADGYELLKVLRLVRTGDTAKPVRRDDTFSPPALVLSASTTLHQTVRNVVERLTLVLRKLGQARGKNDPDPLILYASLSGSLPVLRDMVQDGQVYPRLAYQELSRLAGALFYRDAKGRSADSLPAYVHDAPGPVFRQLGELIEELSETVIQEEYKRCPMAREGDMYQTKLPDSAKVAGAQFFLEVKAADSLPKLNLWITIAKISNPNRIKTLTENVLPGVGTEKLPGQPPQLPASQPYEYFRIKHEQAEWEKHVVPAGDLAVFILNAPTDVEINLIVTAPG
ncbi:MAG: type VI secretion system baseplate subunit TssK [Acidobacteria bacterium]|nr:MAG: type VI secretion system baseplate subunit TssK [Acidobacteriota bacterium]